MSDNEMDVDDNLASDMEEDEIDEELALPPLLANLKFAEKKQLLRFKRKHNERDWEEEILRRSDLLARKVDLERLKKMAGSTTKPSGKESKAAAKPSKGKAGKGKKGKVDSDEDEDEDDDDVSVEKPKKKPSRAAAVKGRGKGKASKKAVEEDEDEDDDDFAASEEEAASEEGEESEDDDDDDDDLFDSDEEEAITKGVKVESPVKGSKLLGKRKAAAAMKAESGLRRSTRTPAKKTDDEDEEEEEDEDADILRDSADEARGGVKKEPGVKSALKKSRLDSVKLEEDDDDSDGGRGGGAAGDSDEDDEGGVFSDSDEEGGGGGSRRLKKRKQPEVEDTSPPAELEDYQRIQSRRGFIIKWLSEPYFETAVVGSFVRVPVGEADNRIIYKMCEVVGVEYTQNTYRLPDTDKPCSIRLTLSIAGSIKHRNKIDGISNSRITDHEFNSWKELMEQRYAVNPSRDNKILTKNQVSARRKKILAATQHTYTHEEIKRMVSSKAGMNKALTTEYSTAMESLQKKLADAKAENDVDLVTTVQKTIDRLEAESARQRDINVQASRGNIQVNKRSRESNVQRDMAAGMRKRQEDQEAAASGKLSNSVVDPFIRRETKPKILWNTGSKLNEEREKENGGEGGNKTASAATAAATTAAPSATVDASAANGGGLSTTANVGASRVLDGELFTIKGGEDSLAEIRKRIKQRLGVDPLAINQEDPRIRYLKKVCQGLPPIGSLEREQLRGKSKSLEEVIEMVRNQRDQE